MSTPAGKTAGKGVNLYTPSTNKASNILNRVILMRIKKCYS